MNRPMIVIGSDDDDTTFDLARTTITPAEIAAVAANPSSGVRKLESGRIQIAYVLNKYFNLASGEHFIGFLLRRGWATEGEIVGAGATAHVYKIGENHIIKVVVLANGYHDMFKQEVRNLLALQDNPYVMRIQAAAIIGPLGYIVSPYVPGQTLTHWLAANPDAAAARGIIYNNVLQAIRHFHWSGIIHRDIKPDNIWVLPDRNILLLDLGIAARQGVSVPGAGTRKYKRGRDIPHTEVPEPNMNYFALGEIVEEFPPGSQHLYDGGSDRIVNLRAPGISRVAAQFRGGKRTRKRTKKQKKQRKRKATV